MAIMAGDLRHRLRFEKPNGAENENGVVIEAWTPVCTVWGGIKDVSGREFYEAAAHKMEHVITFTIRWRRDLDTSMHVIFDDVPFEILQIDRMGYRGDYMRVKAQRIGGEGP